MQLSKGAALTSNEFIDFGACFFSDAASAACALRFEVLDNLGCSSTPGPLCHSNMVVESSFIS